MKIMRSKSVGFTIPDVHSLAVESVDYTHSSGEAGKRLKNNPKREKMRVSLTDR